MRIENTFEVAAPIDRVWSYLLDVEKVVPCMPGAQLTETIDDKNWKGKVTIKLGPVSLSFAGKVAMDELDERAYRAVMKASGMEQRGKGAAQATITSTLEPVGENTRVLIVQDLTVSGQAAQFSRGMMQDVSSKLTLQFAECLQKNMAGEERAAESGEEHVPVEAAKHVGGLGIGLHALGQAIKRFFAKLFKRKK